MPTLSIPRVVVDGTVYTQAQDDTQCSAVETLLNTTKLDAANIQNGAITTPLLASGAVTAPTIASGAVGTSAIAANAITGSLLNANVVDNTSLQLSSNQLSVKSAGVTQAMLAARATGSTVAAGGVAISSSSGTFSTTSSTAVDVTNLSVTITTTGRPVRLELISDGVGSGTGSYSFIQIPLNQARLLFLQGSTIIAGCNLYFSTGGTQWLPSTLSHIDTPAAGTYTYKVQAIGAGGTINVYYYKLVAYEL